MGIQVNTFRFLPDKTFESAHVVLFTDFFAVIFINQSLKLIQQLTRPSFRENKTPPVIFYFEMQSVVHVLSLQNR